MNDHMPDPDAVSVLIGCAQDAEAEDDRTAFVLLPDFDLNNMQPCFAVHKVSERAAKVFLLAGGDAIKPPDDASTDPLRAWLDLHAGQDVQHPAPDAAPCPTCGGKWCADVSPNSSVYPCPTCHGTGVK